MRRTGAVTVAGLVLLGVAVLVRMLQYAANTSLSLDESALALNIVHRSYSGLFQQLDFNQGAPPAFLVLEKLAVDALGNTEYAFRAVPLAAGILSAFLVIPFVRRFVDGQVVEIIALSLFGFSGALVFYSATGKPYAVDVLMTLALYILAGEVMHRPTPKWITIFAIGGAFAIWLSFAAVFVLAGIGSTLIIRSLALRRWREAAAHELAASTWLASFALLYVVSLTDLSHLERSLQSGHGVAGTDASGALQNLSGAIRSDLGIAHLGVGSYDLGRVVFILAALLAMVGFATLVREKPVVAALLAMPALFMLGASAFGKYPLFSRTLLFLVPSTIAFIACGAVRLSTTTRMLRSVGITATTLVLVFIALPTLGHIASPQRTSELKPALRFLAEHQRSADTLWVYHATQYALRYYLECKCFGEARFVHRGEILWPLHPAAGGAEQFSPALKSALPAFIVSRSVSYSTAYRSELTALQGRRRVWILISDADGSIRTPILTFLDHLGMGRKVFRSRNAETTAALYLYDLSRRR